MLYFRIWLPTFIGGKAVAFWIAAALMVVGIRHITSLNATKIKK